MNYYIILLIVIVLILLYFLYVNYIASSIEKIPIVDLNKKKIEIAYKDLPKKDSTRYSYGLWIYVNSWSSTNKKVILSRGQVPPVSDFVLYLDEKSPILRCIIKPNNFSSTNPEDIVITDNFPIQKWTYVVVSVDNQIIDFYLDGKLVLSKKINYIPVVSTNDIILGNDYKNDIFLANVVRTPNPMDPQSVWNTYLNGNGQPNNSNVNIKLSVLQNDIEQKKFTLF